MTDGKLTPSMQHSEFVHGRHLSDCNITFFEGGGCVAARDRPFCHQHSHRPLEMPKGCRIQAQFRWVARYKARKGRIGKRRGGRAHKRVRPTRNALSWKILPTDCPVLSFTKPHSWATLIVVQLDHHFCFRNSLHIWLRSNDPAAVPELQAAERGPPSLEVPLLQIFEHFHRRPICVHNSNANDD